VVVTSISSINAGNLDSNANADAATAKTGGEQGPYPWIISPFLDLFFVCGLGALIFFAVNYAYLGWGVPSSLKDPASWWLITVGALSQHVFADSHNSATYLRIWGSAEDQSRFKFHRTWLAYSVIPMFVMGLTLPKLTSSMVYIYLITVYWHYVAQAFGISLIYCYKRGYMLSNKEKEIFRWFMFSLVGFTTSRFLAVPNYSPKSWYGLEMPTWAQMPPVVHNCARFALIFMTAVFVGMILRKYLTQNKLIPLPSVLCIVTVACLGLSTDMANLMLWLYVPGFFHGSQYIAVCLAYYLKERGMPNGMNSWEISKVALAGPGLKYVGVVVLSGCFFYVGIPHFFNQLGYDYALVAGLVLACVNYHHFITDAAIWRLRDPYCRKILLA
jgi:hypothetical protein